MFGYHGKILRIDLTKDKVAVEPLRTDLTQNFLGGRGIGVKLLYDELAPGIEPLAPENKLVFATGPLTGTRAQTSGRYCVVCKSPLTGTVFDAHSGGHWGAELKATGHDILVVEGKAAEPVYVWIDDEQVEVRDATELWGLDTSKTTDKLLEMTTSKAKVACIGPAGERLVRLSCIINDKHRAAGRGGVGAVMGSKNLKAIVVKGAHKPRIANEPAFKEHVKACLLVLKKNPITKKALPTLGTAVLVNLINELGAFPTHNFQKGVFNNAEGISGEKLAERFLSGTYACYACPIGCGRMTQTSKKSGGGPEYETVWAFGAQCGVKDLETVIEASYLCNELGLDTISTGSTIGCAMELAEKGYLGETVRSKGVPGGLSPPSPTNTTAGGSGGLLGGTKSPQPIKFGDASVLCELTEQMAYKQSIGAILGEGSYRLAASCGHPELSMSVKKLEMPAYDPRGLQGLALAYATSNRGGCHLRAYLISAEVLGAPCLVDRFKTEGKPELVVLMQNLYATIDSAVLCKFTAFAWNPTHYAELLSTTIGSSISETDVLTIGERIWTLERMFNNREGFTRADDSLPPRLTQEPLAEGHSKDRVARLDAMLDEYYELRGWDEDGRPSKEKLEELGLA